MDNVTREVNVLYTSCCHWTLALESTVIMILVTAARTDQDTAAPLLAAVFTGHLDPGPGPELDTRLLAPANWWARGTCPGVVGAGLVSRHNC